jgi:hypothetical protein
MISKKDLKQLSYKRLKDAFVLLNNRRYNASKYIAGYAIELSLKLNICKIFKFDMGFPESERELMSYKYKVKERFKEKTNIRDFKTHDFNKLLFYSGKESDVKSKALDEWEFILQWKPELRYSNKSYNKLEVEIFYKSILKITSILLK